jgi:hypothetical protein
MLAWEAAHLPLYTLWDEASAPAIAFALLHCTLGDVLIGAAALLLALSVSRAGPIARWHWRRVALIVTVVGVGYTAFSEWMNIAILRSWSYNVSMPTLDLGGFDLGLTPLAQWLVVPPLVLTIARYALLRGATR